MFPWIWIGKATDFRRDHLAEQFEQRCVVRGGSGYNVWKYCRMYASALLYTVECFIPPVVRCLVKTANICCMIHEKTTLLFDR